MIFWPKIVLQHETNQLLVVSLQREQNQRLNPIRENQRRKTIRGDIKPQQLRPLWRAVRGNMQYTQKWCFYARNQLKIWKMQLFWGQKGIHPVEQQSYIYFQTVDLVPHLFIGHQTNYLSAAIEVFNYHRIKD